MSSRIQQLWWIVEVADRQGVKHLYGPFRSQAKANDYVRSYGGEVTQLRHPDDIGYDRLSEEVR